MNIFNIFRRKSDKEYLLSKGMTVGKNTQIYSYATIDHTYPHLVTIGDNTIISTNVTILVHEASPNIVKAGTKIGGVKIGNNVFVGTGTIILCNVKIGNDVVIGAGSIVTRDLPGGAVYAGSPAKFICSIEDYKNRMQEQRSEKPNLSVIRAWNQWENAPEEDRAKMKEILNNDIGFI